MGLFTIPESSSAARFCDLCDMGALLQRFGAPYRLGDLERAYMKEYHYSPLTYWAGMKKALRPLFAAGGDTLRALGLPLEGEPQTCHDLACAVVDATAGEVGEDNRDLARQLVDHLREVIG